MKFLPMTVEEINGQVDFVLVTGDAYVDHPSFGASVIGRVLVNAGYSVAILPQPNWKTIGDFTKFGRPRLAFLVTGGNIDSMVNHYTVALKKRKKDAYSPGGVSGKRPNRATIVYSNKIREAYKTVPIILGGIEASLRRMSHYDYWDNALRRSILLDSSADLLVYGMGEKQIIEIANALDAGNPAESIKNVKGTLYRTKDISHLKDYIMLPTYDPKGKKNYAKSFLIQYNNTDFKTAKILVEFYNDVYIVQNVPTPPLTTSEFDKIHSLPFTRAYHPMYEKDGGVPAIDEVKFSIISNRGCFGGCNFCALSFHQGRIVQSRSHKSIIAEAENFTHDVTFKGYIHDVGGPTANFRMPACEKQLTHGACKNRQCLFPTPCKNLKIDHSDYSSLLKKLRQLSGIKKVFIRSGIRYDYLISDKSDLFFKELCTHHISGQLKVAPEHVSNKVLEKMGKPNFNLYKKFAEKFQNFNARINKQQYLVPYLISSHPGSDLNAAIELAHYLKTINHTPEQVQDFYPTPGTLSTCMYFTEMDPQTMKKVYVPKSQKEKAMQRALLQFRLPKNYSLVKEALIKANRNDLIGFDKKCLIKPLVTRDKNKNSKSNKIKSNKIKTNTSSKRKK
ncbi:MAG: YgiQ family radical SAM protein [Defluviitaleaceae bacterium]|nr:YgiQ family radical SAM protein [Defluviitaleaceae bacterium]